MRFRPNLVTLEDRRVPASLLIFEAVLPNPVPATVSDDVYFDGKVITGQNFDSSLDRTDAIFVGTGAAAGHVKVFDGTRFEAGDSTESKATPKLFLFCADGEHMGGGGDDVLIGGEGQDTEIAMSGYIKVKKLNSGG